MLFCSEVLKGEDDHLAVKGAALTIGMSTPEVFARTKESCEPHKKATTEDGWCLVERKAPESECGAGANGVSVTFTDGKLSLAGTWRGATDETGMTYAFNRLFSGNAGSICFTRRNPKFREYKGCQWKRGTGANNDAESWEA